MNIKDYLPMIYSRAKTAYYKVNPIVPVPFDDCVGEAFVIFCQALLKYDPSTKVKFSTCLFQRLKSLERNILITNRMSVNDSFKYHHPAELQDFMPVSQQQIHVEELSSDARYLVSLILSRTIGSDYGEGKGKKLPGIRRIISYMEKNHQWTRKETAAVIAEIKDWWKDYK